MDLIGDINIIWEAIFTGVLGGVIGYDRDASDKSAGIRTFTLIAVSSCLLVNFSETLVNDYVSAPVSKIVSTDPIRMIQAIIIGISFIGGGMIMKDKKGGEVKNLTTAAISLYTAIVGISVALNQYLLAVFLTVFNLLIIIGLNKLKEELPQVKS